MARGIEEVQPFRDVDAHVILEMFSSCYLSEAEVDKIMRDNPTWLLEPGETG